MYKGLLSICVCFVLLNCCHIIQAQPKINDSKLSITKDTHLVWQYLKQTKLLLLREPDSAEIYLQEAEKLSTQLNFQAGLIQTSIAKYSIAFYTNKDIQQAKYHLKIALELAREPKYAFYKAKIYNLLAICFFKSQQLDSSYYYITQSLDLCETKGFNEQIIMVYSSLGNYYEKINEPEQEEAVKLKALNLAYQENNEVQILLMLYHLILHYGKRELWEKRVEMINEYLEVKEKRNKKTGDLGQYHVSLKMFYPFETTEDKIKVLQQDIIFHQAKKNDMGLYLSYLHLGDAFKDQKNYKAAEQAYLKAKETEITVVDKGREMHVEKTLADFYEQTQQYQKLFPHLKRYYLLKDSLTGAEVLTKAKDAEVKYQTLEKEKQIVVQQAQLIEQAADRSRLLYLLALFGGLMVLGTIFIILRTRTNRQLQSQNRTIKHNLAEKELLLKEIHHRVKNNLQVVSGLLKWQSAFLKDKNAWNAFKEGQNRVQSMSIIHQKLYQTDNLTGINMEDYITRLCHSLFRSYQVNNEQVSLSTDIEKVNLDVDTVVPIGLILNELISNALKYAFPDNRKGQISIHLFEDKPNKTLTLIVQDDGIGMNIDDEEKTDLSFGWELIQAFSKKLKAELQIDAQQGTIVRLQIKNYKIA